MATRTALSKRSNNGGGNIKQDENKSKKLKGDNQTIGKNLPSTVKSSSVGNIGNVKVNIITATRSDAGSSITVDPISNLNQHIHGEGSSQKSTVMVASSTPKESYVELRLMQGGITSIENEKRAIQRYVRDTLFSMKKFITKAVELEYTGKKMLVFEIKRLKRFISLLVYRRKMLGTCCLHGLWNSV
jgi:hypothetical protein